MRYRIPILLLVGLCLGLFVACHHSDNNGRPRLTVSIPPQKYLLEAIVGDRYDIVSMLDPGSNPETYEPSMEKVMALEKSDTYFTVGGIDFEQATIERLRENLPNLPIEESGKGIEVITGTHGHHHGDHDGADPHLWVSVRNAQIMARNMYETMLRLDPNNREYYTHRHDSLQKELRHIDESITNTLASCKGMSFVVVHPSLSYFARDYGMNQISIEKDGKEATPAQMAGRIDKSKELKPSIIFSQKESGTHQSQAMASEMGLKLVEIRLNDSDWLSQLTEIANALAAEKNN